MGAGMENKIAAEEDERHGQRRAADDADAVVEPVGTRGKGAGADCASKNVAVAPPDVLVGTAVLRIWVGSPQLISRMARAIKTVKNFRDIPILLSISFCYLT